MLAKANKVTVIGSLNVDHILKVNSLPFKGETIISESYDLIEGGKGANQAVAIGRMGVDVEIIGKIGEDEPGRILVKSLERSNVSTNGLLISKYKKTGAAFITVDKNGNNTIVVNPGANHDLTNKDIVKKESQILESDIVVLQMEIPIDIVSFVIDFAKKNNKSIVLNYAPALELDKEVLAKVDYLVLNEIEFQFLTGEVFKFKNLVKSINKIREFYNNNLIVTLGREGSVLFNNKYGLVRVPAYKVKAVDTTGAGDAFMGGFILGIVEDKNIADCVKLGNASGAISVKKLGAQPSLPYRRELKIFLSNYGEHKT